MPKVGDKPTWAERRAALRHIPPLVQLVWETHHGYTVAMALLRLLRAFVPVATLWIGKLIIDIVVRAVTGNVDLGPLWYLVAAEFAIVVVGEGLARASALVESLLGDLFSNLTSIRLMQHASTLDLHHFEDPAFYDSLERARRQTTARIGLLSQLLSMTQDSITLASLAVALIVYSPWLLLLLAAAVLPSFIGETHFASLEYSMLFRHTPQRRMLDYLRYIGASDETVKELQLFGLSGWIVERYRRLAEKFLEENKNLSIRKAVISTGLSLIGTLGYYGAYIVILLRAVSGAISLGTLTFLAGSFSRSRDLIQRLLLGASDIYRQSLYLKDLFDFFRMQPTIANSPDARQVPRPILHGFVFDDVGFRYRGSDQWAVRHVSFHLRPGERIALVGENGAGKTTLTKLLARLYEPTEGRIILDGIDLREYDLKSLRHEIGVIFQDYVRYDLRFDENIGVGEIGSVQSYLDDEQNGESPNLSHKPDPLPQSLATAAEKSMATSLLQRLPKGYRQMLGRRFEEGIELSGGEWQKIALGRAYMRSAQVLILDEPTASLDARSEYEVFTRFSQLGAGRMAIIISHRFSTVRIADRILVLEKGTIVEDGTHKELLARKGLYAELFTLQAEGYR